YYAPGACSLSPHIALREAGVAFTLEKVDLKTHKLANGGDYTAINPKGYVPALQLDNGEVLTEGPAIVQYIADQKPQAGLAPAAGTLERYHLAEWLSFITSELHKSFSPLFNPDAAAAWKDAARANIAKRLDLIERHLDGKTYLLGERFTVADGYLFTVLNWSGWTQYDLSRWPRIQSYLERIAARPKVREALAAEGLLQNAAA